MPAKMRAAIAPASSMRGRVPAAAAPVTHEVGAAVRRRDRAHRRASWATCRTPSRVLVEHFGVSASRVRHFGSDDLTGPITEVCNAAADPQVDGEAILAAVMESIEDRDLGQADRKVMEARLAHLRLEAEHACQSQQDRALMLNGPGTNDALRKHARVLLEMAALRSRLGLEGA